MEKQYTDKEKEVIFIERTQQLYPYIWDYYTRIIANEKMSREELEAYNWERRKEIVGYAYERSPFYKRYYNQCGFHPDQLNVEADWDLVPVVTKQMLRESLDEMKVENEADKYGVLRSTSGSSGESLSVLNDTRDAVPAIYWRIRGWRENREHGELFGEDGIIGVNEATIMQLHHNSEKACANEAMKQLYYPMEAINLDVHHQNEDSMLRFVDLIKEVTPRYISGNTGSVYDFALFCSRHSIDMQNKVTAIEVCGSVLLPTMRAKIEQVFNAPVYDKYGAIETLLIASECSQAGEDHPLHVFSDVKHIDIVGDNMQIVPVGTDGYTLHTSFCNRVSPLIKYLAGDRTHYINQKCKCGLPFPLIAPVKGRLTDTLTTKNGRKLFSNVFYLIFEECLDSVVIFQFIQHKDLSVTLKVKPNRSTHNYNEAIKKAFEGFQSNFSEQIDFVLEITDNLLPRNGKYSIIVHE